MTAVTASPTAAERVPRPPCTTTRNVASGRADAASSRLCGTTGLLLPPLRRRQTSLQHSRTASGSSAPVRACLRARPSTAATAAWAGPQRARTQSATRDFFGTSHLHPAPQAHSSGTNRKSRSRSRRAPHKSHRRGTPAAPHPPFGSLGVLIPPSGGRERLICSAFIAAICENARFDYAQMGLGYCNRRESSVRERTPSLE